MKADLRTGGGDGPERGDLRSFLRQWDVPPAPPEIEEDLRRTFRRRRARGRRPVAWLSLAAAAALALLALWRSGGKDPAIAPAPIPTGRPVVAASPPPPPLSTAEAGRPRAPVVAPRPSRRPIPPRGAEVVVEPGQARLLVELGRRLQDVRQAVPGTSIPGMGERSASAPATIGAGEQTDVPKYRGEWETVEGEWPYVHRSRPGR